PGGEARLLGDVTDRGAVVAVLRHDLQQTAGDLPPSFLGIRWPGHVFISWLTNLITSLGRLVKKQPRGWTHVPIYPDKRFASRPITHLPSGFLKRIVSV